MHRGIYLPISQWILLAALAAIACFPIVAIAHPMHSEAIERPCEIRQPDNKVTPIKGKCAFFIAGGYLIFELDSGQGEEISGSKFSGAINLTEATGALFQTDIGLLADGEVTLADPSSQLVHMQPGTLAAWKNGYALAVSARAAWGDYSAAP